MSRSTLQLGLGFALLLAAACGPGASAPPAAAAADGTYHARGEIVRLPAAGTREIWIEHESIPDFRNEAGATVGMDSMTMPFPAAEGVPLDGLAAGDRVAFDFEVRWKSEPRLSLTRWEKLPVGTRLEFDPPPAGDQGAPPEPD
jgi:Cu/Ag efflux protein CusF